MPPTYFPSPADFRRWLKRNHARVQELWVGYHKKASGIPSITWPESVDEALCFGWIDGLRKSVDALQYQIRFSPRRPGSVWSDVNIQRARALIDTGRMQPAGLKAFEARRQYQAGNYSYEQRGEAFVELYGATFRKNRTAWAFFQAQPPGYRKTAGWWVVSAKKQETQLSRLARLIEDSAHRRRIDLMVRKKPAASENEDCEL